MKKLVTILLALAMIVAISINAFAAESTSLTINGAEDREIEGYKLLNLTTSLKADDNHADDQHTNDCYNYAYTVNDKYRAVLQNEVFANSDNALATAADVTDTMILEYLGAQTSDEDDTFKSMREVADRLYRAIKTAGIAADAEVLSGKNDTIAQGYWLFADVTNLKDKDEANSLVMVDTKGQDELVINTKTDLPTIEKKVKDINNSADDSIDDNVWQDSADHDKGDVVPFKLTATLPSNVGYYKTYTIVFHDTLSAGLTLDVNSVKVYMYGSKADADADTELKNYAKDVTANFNVTSAGLTFDVACENVLDIDGVTKDSAFVVYYEATLNEAAVLGSAGNPNEVYLEFSNDPYSDSTGKTETDKVIVFTYQVIINKTDAAGTALKGAGFTLYKKDTNGAYVAIGNELVGGDMTTFTWQGLDDGDYKLSETTVPAGYNKMTDIEFTITASHDAKAEEPTLTSLDGGSLGTGVVETGAITKSIINNTGTVLPETGAAGTMWLILGSTMLVIVASVFMITRKKMSVYED